MDRHPACTKLVTSGPGSTTRVAVTIIFVRLSEWGQITPADKAGIAVGDQIKLTKYWEGYRIPNPGESVHLTVRRSGASATSR